MLIGSMLKAWHLKFIMENSFLVDYHGAKDRVVLHQITSILLHLMTWRSLSLAGIIPENVRHVR